MIQLVIVADDFTGALDTGVQFAAAGAATYVITDTSMDIGEVDPEVQVLVVDAETRHLDQKQALQTVQDVLTKVHEAGIPYVYKKTDSALRGNIGAELEAAMLACGSRHIHLLPAFPAMKRTTENGILLIDGVPVSESVFGQDPFEPVCASSVAEIVAAQSGGEIHSMGSSLPDGDIPDGILIYDCKTDADLIRIAGQLSARGELSLTAGCAGFAAVLPGLLNLTGSAPDIDFPDQRLMVVCGSVNKITVEQLLAAEKAGVGRYHLKAEQKLNWNWKNSREADELVQIWKRRCEEEGAFILDSNDAEGINETAEYIREHDMDLEQIRVGIAGCMGAMAKKLLDQGLEATLLLTGGDTLMSFMKQIGVYALRPLGEAAPGAVVSGFVYKGKEYRVVSKSGGFGEKTLILDLKSLLCEENGKERMQNE